MTALSRALDPVLLAEDAGLSPPDPWQADVLRSGSPRMLLNCSRQSGKSSVCGVLASHKALCAPGALVLLLSPSLRQSQELFAKTKAALPVRPEKESALSLELANGSRVISLPGTEKTIRGYSGAALLIVDEAARIADELYFAVRPMLAVSEGSLVMLSTPFGKRGVFLEQWTNGSGWERYEVPASECPRISPAFLEEERRSLPPRVFAQEYMVEFGEVEGAVFTREVIDAAFSGEVEPLWDD